MPPNSSLAQEVFTALKIITKALASANDFRTVGFLFVLSLQGESWGGEGCWTRPHLEGAKSLTSIPSPHGRGGASEKNRKNDSLPIRCSKV